MPDVDYGNFISSGAVNPPGSFEGAVIASAATITVSKQVHKVSGAAAITAINPPFPGFVGFITLVMLGAATIATGGNITSAVAAGANKTVTLYFDGSNWYPDKA
jgi:hypothetical protein